MILSIHLGSSQEYRQIQQHYKNCDDDARKNGDYSGRKAALRARDAQIVSLYNDYNDPHPVSNINKMRFNLPSDDEETFYVLGIDPHEYGKNTAASKFVFGVAAVAGFFAGGLTPIGFACSIGGVWLAQEVMTSSTLQNWSISRAQAKSDKAIAKFFHPDGQIKPKPNYGLKTVEYLN